MSFAARPVPADNAVVIDTECEIQIIIIPEGKYSDFIIVVYKLYTVPQEPIQTNLRQ